MKNSQQNLLIVLAMALCGLCAWQWHEQTLQRDEIGTLNGIVYQKNVDLQTDTNSLARLSQQIQQMDQHFTETKASAATNEQIVVEQKRVIGRLEFKCLGLTNEISQYQQAVNTLSAKLKAAYADIGKQNEAITNLVAQRDDWVNQFNASVRDRNEVVVKYNDLAAQVKELQGGAKQ